ncbi:hypothetical protein [Haloarcula laminariae]|uniref:hypothetical protein n=1 Tax=Haloarcula laminariae TaxID=2961577 RepID=UPI0021C87FD7|nr:hypothetical protein [Halomicroarcula laminariae]
MDPPQRGGLPLAAVILGHAGYLATHNSQRKADTLKQNAIEIGATGEKVRKIIDVFEKGRTDREDLRLDAILRECVDATARRYPEVNIDYNPGPGEILVDGLFDVVCSNVIENAAQHHFSLEPEVPVIVEAGEETLWSVSRTTSSRWWSGAPTSSAAPLSSSRTRRRPV